MIPIQNFIEDALRKVDKLNSNEALDIRTYKRDRRIIIEKEEDSYNLYEDGFEKESFMSISKEELKKLLKVMQRKEFPRSNIVRFTIINRE